jgi:hypothetical protein
MFTIYGKKALGCQEWRRRLERRRDFGSLNGRKVKEEVD